jgi:lysophospholipase L1-like esterase
MEYGMRPNRYRRLRFPTVLTLSVVLAAILASCGGAAAARPTTRYYVSVGDSYAVGYQPSPTPGATGGYTAVVAKGTHLKLVNFGCGGATTTSILQTDGCAPPYGPPAATDAASYPGQTQASAAEAFIRRHKGDIGLITVTIGGNDVTHCATTANPVTCVAGVVGELGPHVTTLAKGLRAAAGPKVPIIGLTYPDVILGEWVYPPGKPDQSLASLSVTAFKSLINPELKKAYASAKAKFVDITADTDAYQPLSQTTTLAPFGTVPEAVAKVCELTWYCQLGNIHAKTVGYDLIGKEVLATYRKATR